MATVKANNTISNPSFKRFQFDPATDNYFAILESIDITPYVVTKGNTSTPYLPWAEAWALVKRVFPDSTYGIHKNPNTGLNYFSDGKSCYVEVEVTVCGITNAECLPVFDNRYNSIAAENVDSKAVNKAIQRALCKACAKHGLGLALYGATDPTDLNAGAVESAPVAPPTATQQPIAQTTVVPQGNAPQQEKSLGELTEARYNTALRKKAVGGRHDGLTLGEIMATDSSYVTEYLASKLVPQTKDQESLKRAAEYIVAYNNSVAEVDDF